MEEIKIGRYEITTKFDRKEGNMDYYDIIIKKDDKVIKISKGCIGAKSCEFWKNYAIKIVKRLDILYTRKDMVLHNQLCYSANALMTKPKEGYEKEWQETEDEFETIEAWIQEIESDFIGGVHKA